MAPKIHKILVINPNTSKEMTASVEQLIAQLNIDFPTTTQITTYTAPTGLASINNSDDCLQSARIVYEDLRPRLEDYDAHLVACYSVHPLVGGLQDELPPGIHVTGIFEASIITAVSLLPMSYNHPTLERLETRTKFGIVSTGSYWEAELADGVRRLLDLQNIDATGRFKGVETTGLTAGELHTADPELVKRKMVEATRRLVRDKDVKVVCLGCAGMVGMEDVVYEALVQELGVRDAKEIHILDGVKAGIALLEGLMRTLPRKG
ncbi:related to DCG1 protein [Rhynchosporium secalis]|uniref:Related to DCG1 protein n=1 Tax=Rhynchosporium secalis TaxID=38038 RepID=A0A1E1LY42_RHYSE|nr:related to DCG1 protein [Rhynchosporium secalis]